jgi:hypothetical protein
MGRLRYLSPFPVLFALPACGPAHEGPSEEEIERHLQIDLPVGYELTDISIEAVENAGSAVEPVYRTRAMVEMELADDFYKTVSMVGEKAVVQQVMSDGEDLRGVVITGATPAGEGWAIEIDRDERPWLYGRAGEGFGPGGFVLQNSSEHREAIEAEEERQRQAAEKRRQKDEATRLYFAGTWRSTGPLLVDGRVWQRTPHRVGFEISLAPSENGNGRGTLKLYALDDRSVFSEGGLNYTHPPGGEYVEIKVDQRVHLNAVHFSVIPQATWKLSQNGRFGTRYLNDYQAELEKVR